MDSCEVDAEVSDLVRSLVTGVSSAGSFIAAEDHDADRARKSMQVFQPASDNAIPCSSTSTEYMADILTCSDVDSIVNVELSNLRISRQIRGRKRRLRNRDRERTVLKLVTAEKDRVTTDCDGCPNLDAVRVNSILQESLPQWTRIASSLPETNDELDDYRLAMSMYINSKLLYINNGLSKLTCSQAAMLSCTRNQLTILGETVERIRGDLKAEIESLRKNTVTAIRHIVECDKNRREKMQAQWEQVQLFVRRKNKRIKELTKQVSCADVDVGFLLNAHKGRIEAASIAERKYGRAAEQIEQLQAELESKIKLLEENRCHRCGSVYPANRDSEELKMHPEHEEIIQSSPGGIPDKSISASELHKNGGMVSSEVHLVLKARLETMEKEMHKLEERATHSANTNDILSRNLLQYREIELKLKSENELLKAECAKLRSDRDRPLVANEGSCIETPPDSNSSDKSKDDSSEYDVRRAILPKPPAPPEFLATEKFDQRGAISDAARIDSWLTVDRPIQSDYDGANKPVPNKRIALDAPIQCESKRPKVPKGPAPPLMPPSVQQEMSQGFFGERRVIRRDLSPPSPQYEPIRNESWQQNDSSTSQLLDWHETDERSAIRRLNTHCPHPRCAPPLTPYNIHNRPLRPPLSPAWQNPRFVRPRPMTPTRPLNSWWPHGGR